MTEQIDTMIIGGGQAGLAMSYLLTQHNRPHIILEQASQVADTWRSHRWDSFTLLTPNWQLQLPGFAYQGDHPDSFSTRPEIVDYLERYAASFNPPIRFGVRVTGVDPIDAGYRVQTTTGDFETANVIVATGIYQQPKIPAFAAKLPPEIRQLHSGEYRNPENLPPGAVLVVGSAQSGAQIAEELYQSGRKVYLCVSSTSGRLPRRYRGKDCAVWLNQMGFFDRRVDKLPSPKAKFAGAPHFSGKDGGHSLNLHQFARDGVTLLGRMTDAQGDKVFFAPDLKENLAKADQFEANIVKNIDDLIAKNAIDAPLETLPVFRDGFEAEIITELDLKAAGITSTIWANGYVFDFSWIHLPVLDDDGYPVQTRGVSAHPGLYFVGLHWLYTFKSGLFFGVGEDAAHVAGHLAANRA